jgi:hypothetical protein
MLPAQTALEHVYHTFAEPEPQVGWDGLPLEEGTEGIHTNWKIGLNLVAYMVRDTFNNTGK